MNKYREKPVVPVVDAFQMTKERRLDNSEWPAWLHRAWQKEQTEVGSLYCVEDPCHPGETCTPLFIQTEYGTVKVEWGEWIIYDSREVLSRSPEDLFEITYEKVDEN